MSNKYLYISMSFFGAGIWMAVSYYYQNNYVSNEKYEALKERYAALEQEVKPLRVMRQELVDNNMIPGYKCIDGDFNNGGCSHAVANGKKADQIFGYARPDSGKFTFVWEEDSVGNWKIVMDTLAVRQK